MKIFQTHQIREIDSITIQEEPIESFQLMKRASRCFFEKLLPYLDHSEHIAILAGSGNNGGDALVIANLLDIIGQPISIYLVNPKNQLSNDCQKAYTELSRNCTIQTVQTAEEISFENASIIIDGLFGSGLNRPLEGAYRSIVDKINQSGCKVFSIDIPSGLFGEDNTVNHHEHIVNATYTFTFQTPKPCFFFAENEKHLGKWEVLDIHLHPKAIDNTQTPYYLTEEEEVKKMAHVRGKFSHKGTFGHALLISGSYGMMGASILATKAALRTGCGLVTTHIPQKGYEIMQISVPEAIVSLDKSETHFTGAPDLSKYNAIGIGPGLGTNVESLDAFRQTLLVCQHPMVIDADALNLLAKDTSLWDKIPQGSILTPHPKEFERICGEKTTAYQSWVKQIELSQRYKVIIVLKGAYSSISLPDGSLHINSTGNPGMATAGSGDTLTGIITSLLAQSYKPEEAAILGTWLHGKAGDLALMKNSEESLIASDIIQEIGNGYKSLHSTESK